MFVLRISSEASAGQILFGGIDTAKYDGTLSSLEIYPDAESGSNRISTFTVAFTSLQVTSSTGTDTLTLPDYAEPAILDSGTSLTLLPDNLASVIFGELGATTDSNYGVVLPCAVRNATGSLDFGFGGLGGPVIKVSISELVLPLYDSAGNVLYFKNGEAACQLGIEAAAGRPVLFGDTFLRSAYVVYDLVNNRIGIAQSNFNTGNSHVVAFASSGAPIPSATTALGGIAITQTATGNPHGTLGDTGTGTAAPTVQGSIAASLSAANGFASATGPSISTQTTLRGVAGTGPRPFAWDAVAVLGASLGMVLVGSGVFSFL
jgi:hypothetical protein